MRRPSKNRAVAENDLPKMSKTPEIIGGKSPIKNPPITPNTVINKIGFRMIDFNASNINAFVLGPGWFSWSPPSICKYSVDYSELAGEQKQKMQNKWKFSSKHLLGWSSMIFARWTARGKCIRLDWEWRGRVAPLNISTKHTPDAHDDTVPSQWAIQWQNHYFVYKIWTKCRRGQNSAVASLEVTQCPRQKIRWIWQWEWPIGKSSWPFSSPMQQGMWKWAMVMQMFRRMC